MSNGLYCGNCAELLANMDSDTVDCAITSPPYGKVRKYKGFVFPFEEIARQLTRVLKPGGVIVWVVADTVENGSETGDSFRQALFFKDECNLKLHDTMIWAKTGCTYPDPTRYNNAFEYMFVFSKGKPKTINLQTKPNKWAGDRRRPDSIRKYREADGFNTRKRKPVKEYGVMNNIWTIEVGFGKTSKDKITFDHPAPFPELLAERHILTWTNPGDLVLDPMAGSGTVPKMAIKHDRNWIGMDISQEYINQAKQRLLTVQKSLL